MHVRIPGRYVYSHYLIARRYVSTWFVIDLVSVSPSASKWVLI